MEERINEEIQSEHQNFEKISIPINIAETKKYSKVYNFDSLIKFFKTFLFLFRHYI